MGTAFDRPDRDRIGHQERLETCFDGEQAGDLAKHRH